MNSAATNDTAPHSDRDWSAPQRAGFAVVLIAAAATLGIAALTGPQESTTAIAADAAEQQTATRGDISIANCNLVPHGTCIEADLNHADLRSVDLTGANLEASIFVSANLSRANLHDANLHNTEFLYADLTDAVLTDATVTYANLASTKMVGANLTYADLSGRTDLSGADLTGADLTDADLTTAIFHYTTMPDGSTCADGGQPKTGISHCDYDPN